MRGDWKSLTGLLLVFLAGMVVCQGLHMGGDVLTWRSDVESRLEASDGVLRQVIGQNKEIIELLKRQGLVTVVPAVPVPEG